MLDKKNIHLGESPGSPVVRIPCSHCGGLGLIPGRGTKILQAAQHGQKKKIHLEDTVRIVTSGV